MKMKNYSGFTLIELMVVVAIIGIIAGLAWPAYQNHIVTSQRADAQGVLMSMAQAMEQHFTQNGSYTGAADGGADTGSPSIFSTEAPLDSSNKTYDLTIESADDSSYTIRATPKNAQAGDGVIELRSSGVRAWDRGDDGAFADPDDLCWSSVCN
ncbi:type IV pilin protein [Microbulbifer sp. JMSA004]|uniref:type IV pilin protein n=1 Tax=Microbulbifer sp. JMSA004 TaxID=3243370 RepID=UPI004039403B